MGRDLSAPVTIVRHDARRYPRVGAALWPGQVNIRQYREPWRGPGQPNVTSACRHGTRHCHNSPFRLPERRSGLTRRGFPLRISRREFVAASGAVLATAALMGTTSLAFADPTVEELMRPGPLPDLVEGKADP